MLFKFKVTESRETFHFKPPIQIEGSWMIGLTSVEVYTSIFELTEEYNKLKVYLFPQ